MEKNLEKINEDINRIKKDILKMMDKMDNFEQTIIRDQIRKLSDLKDQGIITEEEFQKKKNDLLDKVYM